MDFTLQITKHYKTRLELYNEKYSIKHTAIMSKYNHT